MGADVSTNSKPKKTEQRQKSGATSDHWCSVYKRKREREELAQWQEDYQETIRQKRCEERKDQRRQRKRFGEDSDENTEAGIPTAELAKEESREPRSSKSRTEDVEQNGIESWSWRWKTNVWR